MQISPILPKFIPATNNLLNSDSSKKKYNQIPHDVFVKTPTFSAMNTFSHNYSHIKPIIKQMYSERKVNLKSLEEVIQRFFPHINVRDMREAPLAKQSSEFGAYFQNQIGFSKTFEVKDMGQALFFRMPNESADNTNLNFFINVVHEITHVIQENSSDRVKRSDWMRKTLQNANDKNTVMADLVVLPQIFSSLEQVVILPLREFMMKSDNLPREILVKVEPKLINDIYKKVTGANYDSYVDFCLSEIFKRIGFNCSKDSLSRVLKYSKQYALDEYEAYKNGTDFGKEMLGIKSSTDLDLRVQAYRMLADRLDFLINITK